MFAKLYQHRRHWVGKTESDTERDDTALLDHYRNFHATTYKRWCSTKTILLDGFHLAYKVIFVDRVSHNLTEQEDFWHKRIKSQINRCKIFTPKITEF